MVKEHMNLSMEKPERNDTVTSDKDLVTNQIHRVRVRTPKWRKKRSLPSQSGRSRTGKYCDGAWAEAHTSRGHPLRTRSPCYGASPRPTNPGIEGAYAIKVSMRSSPPSITLLILLLSAHGPYHVFPQNAVFTCSERSDFKGLTAFFLETIATSE